LSNLQAQQQAQHLQQQQDIFAHQFTRPSVAPPSVAAIVSGASAAYAIAATECSGFLTSASLHRVPGAATYVVGAITAAGH
ncbi:MAG: hypothetical protein ACKPKO_32425, partial [Candidatus Fonsibacter sp.]